MRLIEFQVKAASFVGCLFSGILHFIPRHSASQPGLWGSSNPPRAVGGRWEVRVSVPLNHSERSAERTREAASSGSERGLEGSSRPASLLLFLVKCHHWY